MKNYVYNNKLVGKKQLKALLAWCFANYNLIEACRLADELKHLGFKYATKAGISISIEDLKVPFIKNQMLRNANKEVLNIEKISLKGKITDVERFQKVINIWGLTSESLKNEVISYFKNYEPLNSVYIMAFSGARGNVSQVRQLVGMRGLMADPSGAILKLPIKKNFREGLTITDYLMSAYGARKGIVDTALKTANSGYLTRRLIDVAQDIIIREKDCFSNYSYVIFKQNEQINDKKILGRALNRPIYFPNTTQLLVDTNTQINYEYLNKLEQYKIKKFYLRSPLSCNLYRSVCQKCYGWDIAKETLIDFGEAVGIIAGQSIGEPGTQLTMRTFHTGGIFTSEFSKQLKSPSNGLIKFSKKIKTLILRTNKGETVRVTKNSGYLSLIPEKLNSNLIQIDIIRNTILFVKNNQYIRKNDVIGELITNTKQIRTELVPIMSMNAGEIFIPNLKIKTESKNIAKNQLLWLFSGQLYKSPKNSFLNLYSDYKINKYCSVFRTKLISPFSGFICLKKNIDRSQQTFKIKKNKQFLRNCNIQKWSDNYYILNHVDFKYILNRQKPSSQKYFGQIFTNKFRTLTGGTIYYSTPINTLYNKEVFYYKLIDSSAVLEMLQDIIFLTDLFVEVFDTIKTSGLLDSVRQKKNWKKLIFYNSFISTITLNFNRCLANPLSPDNYIKISNTLIWLNEETYKLDCSKNKLLVKNGDFIPSNFEIFPNVFSKTQGLITFYQKNNQIQTFTIKSGLIHKEKKFLTFSKKVYFPGERIGTNLIINEPSFCEDVSTKKITQLLVRPLIIYEIPFIKSINTLFENKPQFKNTFTLSITNQHFYKSNQTIKRSHSINLFLNILKIKSSNISTSNLNVRFLPNWNNQSINIVIIKKIFLNQFIPPSLNTKYIQSLLVVEDNQFLNSYNNFGYFESTTNKALKIVKVKSKCIDTKQFFLISNEDCITVEKDFMNNKTVNDLVINKQNIKHSGRIIIDNNRKLTIQKGRPYFFPNCKNEESNLTQNVKYKLFSQKNKTIHDIKRKKYLINLKYFDVTKKNLILKHCYNNSNKSLERGSFSSTKIQFRKMFIKKNNKFYISLTPILLTLALVKTRNCNKTNLSNLKSIKNTNEEQLDELAKRKFKKLHIFLRNSTFSTNYVRNPDQSYLNYSLFRVFPTLFQKSIKIYPITEDYFENDYNNVFCKNNQFIENGQILGLLNFEKEITGDIVQGLPRIEQLFEARKVRLLHKLISTSKKKYLLIQKTSIDSSFEFRKLGMTIRENEKINPHNLLKVYFKYYGSNKFFFCDRTKTFVFTRLMNNYEACYRTFKKVQALILSLIQSVYKSQGVTIIDKHFEVILNQMTNKVLITYEGNTSLLPREIIHLYHIKHINKTMEAHNKQSAFYVPVLFGITKAALNNPSFISAASFQETTRVLTKAAIEGKLDWLRGLKENITVGRLIPAGTGAKTYRNCFKKKPSKSKLSKLKLKKFK